MENPATWGRAEKVINNAYGQWHDARMKGVIGLSLARYIADSLRVNGLLKDGTEEENKVRDMRGTGDSGQQDELGSHNT